MLFAMICSRRLSTACFSTSQSSSFLITRRLPPKVAESRCKLSFWEATTQYVSIYSSNSIFAQFFVKAYQALAALSFMNPTTSILVTTIGLRLLTLPLYSYSEALTAKRLVATNLIQRQVCEKVGKHYGVKPILDLEEDKWTLQTTDKTILGNVEELTRKTMTDYYHAQRLTMHRIVYLKLSTVPMWMHFSMGLKSSVNVSETGQDIPGFLWVPSLAEVDPYMILPICSGALTILSIWAHKWMFIHPTDEKKASPFRYVGDGLMIVLTVFCVRMLSEMPAIQSLFWSTVVLTNICQNVALRNPTVKRWLRIGQLPYDSNTPFRDLFRFRRIRLPSNHEFT